MRDLLDFVKKLYASLLIYMDYCSSLSFGSVFQPRTFSAQDLSTSELLRTLLMDGCF